jgi:hypothetical protein
VGRGSGGFPSTHQPNVLPGIALILPLSTSLSRVLVLSPPLVDLSTTINASDFTSRCNSCCLPYFDIFFFFLPSTTPFTVGSCPPKPNGLSKRPPVTSPRVPSIAALARFPFFALRSVETCQIFVVYCVWCDILCWVFWGVLWLWFCFCLVWFGLVCPMLCCACVALCLGLCVSARLVWSSLIRIETSRARKGKPPQPPSPYIIYAPEPPPPHPPPHSHTQQTNTHIHSHTHTHTHTHHTFCSLTYKSHTSHTHTHAPAPPSRGPRPAPSDPAPPAAADSGSSPAEK